MKKNEYYQNKIIYALDKIEFAKGRMTGKDNKSVLSKVYSVLLRYKTNISLKKIMELTELNRDQIIPALKTLKEINLVDWNGTYLNKNKKIIKENYRPDDPKAWYEDLQRKLQILNKADAITKEDTDEKKQPDVTNKDDTEWVEIKFGDDMIVKVTKDKLKEKLFM